MICRVLGEIASNTIESEVLLMLSILGWVATNWVPDKVRTLMGDRGCSYSEPSTITPCLNATQPWWSSCQLSQLRQHTMSQKTGITLSTTITLNVYRYCHGKLLSSSLYLSSTDNRFAAIARGGPVIIC